MTTPQEGTARSRQRAQTRERIVEAAAESFSEFGFRAASTREIASRAGTNQGLITYHFQTKDLLWRAAADRIFGDLADALGRQVSLVEAIPDPRERSREFVRTYVRYAAAHPEVIRFLLEEGKYSDDRMEWLVDRHMRPLYDRFRRFAAGFRNDLDESLLPHFFYSMAGAASVIFAVVPECQRLTGLDPTTDEAVERHADLVAQLLVP